MITSIIVLHILVCIGLILIVLLQTGKGASMGAAFGGASQTLFGSAGPATFLGRLTTIAAVIFMLTSLSLAYISTHRQESKIIKGVVKEEGRQSTGEPVPPSKESVPEIPPQEK